MSGTFKDHILEVADGEPIEAIVVGKKENWGDEGCRAELQPVQTWDDAIKSLEYPHNTDFGALGCHSITAWTATKVIFVSQYDGSTTVCSVPRHPIAHFPTMMGE